MEEEKAAAYYDELTRKGGGAARFKQGLGFSSATSNDAPSIGSALPSSSSSFMSNFVRASSPTKGKEIEKKTQIENIQNKLKKKEPTTNSIDASNEKTRVRVRDRRSRSRSRSRERERGEDPRRDNMKTSKSKNRSLERRKGRNGSGSDEERERSRRRYRSPSKERRRERSRERRRRRRSRSLSDGEKKRGRNRERNRSKSRSRSPPRDRKQSGRGREARAVKKEGNVAVDYAKLIDGYDKMTPAEKVKAKMKLQLSQTAEKDTKMGIDSQWERFDFNKDAPVDDAEIEAADDDVALVKQIGKSFRFTSLEGKREDEIKNAHDEAMFGAPAPNLSNTSESGEEKERENEDKETNDDASASSLINEKVIWKQQGSWRDRARRNVV